MNYQFDALRMDPFGPEGNVTACRRENNNGPSIKINISVYKIFTLSIREHGMRLEKLLQELLRRGHVHKLVSHSRASRMHSRASRMQLALGVVLNRM